MGVERLIGDRSQAKSFVAEIKAKQAVEQSEGHMRSLVAIWANCYLNAGAEGLRELSKQFGNSQVAQIPTIDSPELVDRVIFDVAGIFLGNTIITIEESLIDRNIDLAAFCSRYDQAFSATVFNPKVPKNHPIIGLDNEEWLKMISFANTDKTLAIFIKDSKEAMPQVLQEVLKRFRVEKFGLLSFARDNLIDHYHAMANHLI